MGTLQVAMLIMDLVTTFGPKAKEVFDTWMAVLEPGTEPTAEDWAMLRKKIDEHDPDTY